MSVKLAYIGIIIIWSTTPLSVQWGAESDPFFAVALRILIGLGICWMVVSYQGVKVSFAKRYLPIYCVSGLSIFLAMSLVYWSAQYLPSGWISVLYGLSPIFTGVFAFYYLDEKHLSANKIIGMLLGLIGLIFVFASGLKLQQNILAGAITCFFAVIVTAGSSVWIKHLNQGVNLSGLQVNIGGLSTSLPLFILLWIGFSDDLIPAVSLRSGLSILYTGIVATALGFSMYYYLLKNIDATRVALISLITPVASLILGSWLNDEPVVATVWFGTALICFGLISFEFKGRPSWLQLKKYFRGI